MIIDPRKRIIIIKKKPRSVWVGKNPGYFREAKWQSPCSWKWEKVKKKLIGMKYHLPEVNIQVRYHMIDYVVIIVCITIVFSKVYSHIMVLLYPEKKSTVTTKLGAETCPSTDRPILFYYIIRMRNGNIFDDYLNTIPITIRSWAKDSLRNISNNCELRVFPSNFIALLSSKTSESSQST